MTTPTDQPLDLMNLVANPERTKARQILKGIYKKRVKL